LTRRIALKVDVDTLRGTQQGVPNLLRLFDAYNIRATFLFSLGPDHTGRAIKRLFRPGFFSKVRRTSVASHYGMKTLLYGTLLPGPHIGRHTQDEMRSVQSAGHEVGLHCYDHVKWQDNVASKGEAWTRHELQKAAVEFERIFGRRAQVHGAAGWQINRYTLQLEEELGFTYASDTRGESPFYPVMQGVVSRCPQIPTTLPTLDELLGRECISAQEIHRLVFDASQRHARTDHVYTLHAELEGMQLLPVLERLVKMWQSTQHELVSVDTLYRDLDLQRLQQQEVFWGRVEGRSGVLAMQGLSDA
jgi:undecaprenyl phosphate-alpha-L-ara4FN deformylase